MDLTQETIDRLAIQHYPSPVLHDKSSDIGDINDSVRSLAEKMISLMHVNNGVGLSAPQIGISSRMFVTSQVAGQGDLVFINPFFSSLSKKMKRDNEGCLSLPGITVEVNRHQKVTIKALNLDGEEFELEAEDLSARILQHEHNHLDGALIVDKMSFMDKIANKRTLRFLESEHHRRMRKLATASG